MGFCRTMWIGCAFAGPALAARAATVKGFGARPSCRQRSSTGMAAWTYNEASSSTAVITAGALALEQRAEMAFRMAPLLERPWPARAAVGERSSTARQVVGQLFRVR